MRALWEDEAEEGRASGGQGRSEKSGEAAPAGLNKLYSSGVRGREGGELARSISWEMNAADACGRREGWRFEFHAGAQTSASGLGTEWV